MKGKSRIILKDSARDSFERLNELIGKEPTKQKNSFEGRLFKALKDKIELLKNNPFYGTQIQKKLIPKELTKKYSLTNLWRIELPNFWRALYTVKGEEVEIFCIILEICDHKKYNKLFGYKNK